MSKVLVVIDAQLDFTTGRLGSEQAALASRKLQDYLKNHKEDYKLVIATLDTHATDEFTDERTVEGKQIPKHCVLASQGYALVGDLADYVDGVMEKSTFMAENFNIIGNDAEANDYDVDEIDICGFCTDICVVSNALLLRREYPEINICVLDDLCAGTSESRHQAAIDVMESCLITHRSSESCKAGHGSV